MNRSNLFLVILVIVLGILFTTGLLYYFRQKSSPPDNKMMETVAPTAVVTQGPRNGEVGYQETKTTVKIGTNNVTKGTFEKVDNSYIYLNENNEPVKVALSERIAIECTTQDLNSATELDFNKVTKVQRATAANLSDYLKADQTVVVFSQNVEATTKAHTIALADSSCTF